MPPLVAVTAVVGVIVILLVLNNRPSPAGPAPGAVAEKPASARITESPSPSPSVSTAAAAPPASQPAATQSPAQSVAAMLPVTVLNNSRISHLASRVAADLRAHGWPVRKTGNFTGRVRAITIYYGPGQHASAVRLARTFRQIRRVEPRFAGLPGRGLTLVVTRDWSS